MDKLSEHIAAIRTDYRMAALDEQTVGNDPLVFFRHWFSEAEAAEIHEVNAMTLATADESGKPHARIVLLKGLDEYGFVFFTNYDSDKGHQLSEQPNAALVFFWKELERQVRVEGIIEKVSSELSDEYFHSRPINSQLGAWASPQSKVIENREILDERLKRYTNDFADHPIPRPEHWGGYRVIPNYIEFWQGRSSRLHDRLIFKKAGGSDWTLFRIAP